MLKGRNLSKFKQTQLYKDQLPGRRNVIFSTVLLSGIVVVVGGLYAVELHKGKQQFHDKLQRWCNKFPFLNSVYLDKEKEEAKQIKMERMVKRYDEMKRNEKME